MQHGQLTEQTDLPAADWLVERMTTFGENVASIIPEGFERYARIFHPPEILDEDGWRPGTWAEVARTTGRIVHPEMQWEGVSGQSLYHDRSSLDSRLMPPASGNLPRDHAERLVTLLRHHTSTPSTTWFLTWIGWGGHRLDPRPGTYAYLGKRPTPVPRRPTPLPPTVELPGRSYFLLGGPLEGALETMSSPGIEGGTPGWQSVTMWWPEDRAWIVSTEIDFSWTYVGGSSEAIEAVLLEPALESLPAELHHGVSYDSDRLNPPPAPPRI